MDVTNVPSADREEPDHPVQVGSQLVSDGVESTFDGTTVNATEVTFCPDERAKFHAHVGVQILYVTDDEVIVATRDEERKVTEGDLVIFDPGEKHWHGTAKDVNSVFNHVYVQAEPDDGELTIGDTI